MSSSSALRRASVVGIAQWVACVCVALAAWFLNWRVAESFDTSTDDSTTLLFALTGVAVFAGTTVTTGGGIMLSTLLMTIGTLLAGFDLTAADQLTWFPIQGTLITACVGAQALGQQIRRENPTVSSSLFATRIVATAAAAIAGGIVTVAVLNLAVERTLRAAAIPAGLLLGAAGLIGLQLSLRAKRRNEPQWIPPPPVAGRSQYVSNRATLPGPLATPSPPPPTTAPVPPRRRR